MARHAAPKRRARKVATAAALSSALVLPVLATPVAAEASPSSRTVHRVVKYDTRGKDVKWLQRKLNVHPHSGWFGPLTRAAVKRFQRSHGIAPTGVVGRRTWQALGATWAPRHSVRATNHDSHSSTASTTRDQRVIHYAKKYSGTRYRWGGSSPRTGFDCSGYTRYVYKKVGVHLPHQSTRQYHKAHRISRGSARPGDLVFFHSGRQIYHVGIFAGKHRLYHASKPGRPVGKGKIWTSKVWYARVKG